jgi:hypothetical protein
LELSSPYDAITNVETYISVVFMYKTIRVQCSQLCKCVFVEHFITTIACKHPTPFTRPFTQNMEFSFDLAFIAVPPQELVAAGFDNIVVVSAASLTSSVGSRLPSPPLTAAAASRDTRTPVPSGLRTPYGSATNTGAHQGGVSPGSRSRAYSSEVLDRIGLASAGMQGLPTAITSAAKVRMNPDHRVYIAFDGNTALGFIKVGVKTLFVSRNGAFVELSLLSVLDFAVMKGLQRRGVGKKLFDAMCLMEKVSDPSTLAYDRPSAMFLSFLSRHFGLKDFTPQPNNFVVFEDYFMGRRGGIPPSRASTTGSVSRGGDSTTRIPRASATPGGPLTPSFTVGAQSYSDRLAATGEMRSFVDRLADTDAAPSSSSRSRFTPASTAAPFATDDNVAPCGGVSPHRRFNPDAPKTTITLQHQDADTMPSTSAWPTRSRAPGPATTDPLADTAPYTNLRVTPSTRPGVVNATISGWQGPGATTTARVGFEPGVALTSGVYSTASGSVVPPSTFTRPYGSYSTTSGRY